MCYNIQMHSHNYVGGMVMRFDTTHEYYFNDACIHYCEDHDCLMICSHGESTDRLMIEGLGKDVLNKFRLELNKEHLNNTIADSVEAVS